jgi:hypothetical protein
MSMFGHDLAKMFCVRESYRYLINYDRSLNLFLRELLGHVRKVFGSDAVVSSGM